MGDHSFYKMQQFGSGHTLWIDCAEDSCEPMKRWQQLLAQRMSLMRCIVHRGHDVSIKDWPMSLLRLAQNESLDNTKYNLSGELKVPCRKGDHNNDPW